MNVKKKINVIQIIIYFIDAMIANEIYVFFVKVNIINYIIL
jgi:hypothetical protein